MINKKIVIRCASGLHARPAANVMKAAKKHASKVQIINKEKTANAKSLVEILGLGANRGDEVVLICDGEDEEAAAAELQAIMEDDCR
ncbi:MAG: HPr family phosphocarrier protein [Bacillota bacterium]